MTRISMNPLLKSVTVGRILGVCLCVTFVMASMRCMAEEGNPAGGRLDKLKQRSAIERWQRIKSQYPVDPPAPRRQAPARLPEESHQILPDDQLLPSPKVSYPFPRLTAIPNDTVPDWVLPIRQPVDVGSADASIVPSPAITSDQIPSASRAPNEEPKRTGKLDQPDMNSAAENAVSGNRSLHERKIDDIKPFYDRDRDRDIRDFANEKSKEFDSTLQNAAYSERSFPQMDLAWEPANFHHYPLYFSDPALERYGHAHHPLIQPLASIGRFGAQFVMLPYQMTINPPCKDEYTLGWYRPGECAPKLHYQIPLNAEAAAVQAAAVTGLYFLIP